MWVSLFKGLLLRVRNLRAESDCIHALAHVYVERLFVSISLPRKALESCFQLSLPLPEQKNSGKLYSVVIVFAFACACIGALSYGTGYGALNWTEPALEVVEVCRPCVKWDCDGRTYTTDCYLKLLVRLCCIYDTRGGVKKSQRWSLSGSNFE